MNRKYSDLTIEVHRAVKDPRNVVHEALMDRYPGADIVVYGPHPHFHRIVEVATDGSKGKRRTGALANNIQKLIDNLTWRAGL